MKKVILAFILVVFFGCAISATEIQEIIYSYYGKSFRAKILVPESTKPLPVIIYNYDPNLELYKKKDPKLFEDIMRRLMRNFESNGYISFIPQEQYSVYEAVRAGIEYMSRHPKADKKRISLMSIGGKVFLTLLVLPEYSSKLKACVMISSGSFDQKGFYSLAEFKKKIPKIDVPFYFMVGAEQGLWFKRNTRLLYDLFLKQEKKVFYREYPEADMRTFWNSEGSYMWDVFQFFGQES